MPDTRTDLLQTDTRITLSGVLNAAEIEVPALTVICHPEPGRVGERALLTGLSGGQDVCLSRGEPPFGAPGKAADRPLHDPHLSRSPLRWSPGPNRSLHLDCSGSTTRVVADGEPLPSGKFFSAEALERGVILLLSNRVVLVLHWVEPFVSPHVPHFDMVGEASSMLHVRHDVQRVCDIEIPVLVRGETGTGKELVARGIHGASPRRDGPFVAINMGAVPPSLAASELFGAAKGAFTGAHRQRSGYFRQAEGGTLFLDEIGETPPEIQVLLLRAIQEGVIRPVGAEKDERVDVRLIAATDADLETAVREDRFREPLLHRLSGYELQLPPLRRKRDDFGRLFYHFLTQELALIRESHHLEPPAEWLPAPLVARLAGLSWPGNVRQLRNVVRQLVIASRGAPKLRTNRQIERLLESAANTADDPPTEESEAITSEVQAAEPARVAKPSYRSPSAISEDELVRALRANRWSLLPTARDLGISRTSLYELIERSPRVRKASDLTREEIATCHEHCGGEIDTMAEMLEVSQRGLVLRMRDLGMR